MKTHNKRNTSFIFYLLSLIFILALPVGAVRKYDIHPVRKPNANPINVAYMLTEQPDSAAIVSTLSYYGYVIGDGQDDRQTEAFYTHPNGSIIRFSFNVAENGNKYPIVEVRSKARQKEKDQILQNLNFQKTADGLERRTVDHITRCATAPHGYLLFSNYPKHGK